MQAVLDELNEHLRDAAKILIDITAAQRNQLDQAIAGSQITVAESKANIVKPDEEHVIWPFNGEYWRDELGTYEYTLTKTCKNIPGATDVSEDPGAGGGTQ